MRLGALVVEFQAHRQGAQFTGVKVQFHVLIAALRQPHHLLAQLLLPGGAGHRRMQGEGAGVTGDAAGGIAARRGRAVVAGARGTEHALGLPGAVLVSVQPSVPS